MLLGASLRLPYQIPIRTSVQNAVRHRGINANLQLHESSSQVRERQTSWRTPQSESHKSMLPSVDPESVFELRVPTQGHQNKRTGTCPASKFPVRPSWYTFNTESGLFSTSKIVLQPTRAQ